MKEAIQFLGENSWVVTLEPPTPPDPREPLADEEIVPGPDQILPWEEVERCTITRALRICGWSVAKAAERLELGQATVYRKIKKYRIPLLRAQKTPAEGDAA